ncbi:MAG: hypothetical protein WC647_19600 [Desulfomonilaceae bacterium]|jgi:hypothetical protein
MMGWISLRATMMTAAYCSILAAVLIVDLGRCGIVPNLSGIAFLTWLPFSCVLWGVIYFRSFSLSDLNLITMESCLITGFWLTSVGLLTAAFFSPNFFLTATLFAIWNIAPLCFLIRNPESLGAINWRWYNLWLLLTIGLSMSLWSQTGVIQKIINPDHIRFLPWSDHFVHASIIQRLYECSKLGVPQEFAMMSGIPAPFYHYGSYMIPSVLRAVSYVPAINISTAFWLPLGGILSGLGAFVLGNGLWGKKEGISCALMITLLPDPYMYGCGLGYFSYHFLGQTGAALFYAEAIAAVGLSLVGKGVAIRNDRQVLGGLVPILSLALFKAHVFIIILPAACLWIMLFFPSISKTKRFLGICLLIIGFVTMALIGVQLRYISFGQPWALEFFRGIFSRASDSDPRIYAWLFGLTQKTLTIRDDIAVGTILLWFATLGPLIIVGAGLVNWLLVKKLLDFKDALPFLCTAMWTGLVVVMPANQYGNLDELHHRPFHVVYYIFVIWLAGRSCDLLFKRVDQWKHKSTVLGPKLKIALALATALLLIVPWHFGESVLNIGPCADRHQNFKIEMDVWRAGEFMRANGKIGDVFLDSEEDQFMNVITGISERRPFLSEPYHRFVSRNVPGSELIDRRQKLHEELRKCDSAECINRIARANKIRWYLTHPSDSLTWESNPKMKPVFEADGYKVFDLDMAQPAHRRH